MKIILASTSPRRKELLEREGIDFIIDASSITEYLDSSLEIEERLKKLAYDKGVSIHEKYPDDVVISADTTIYHNGKVIGKAHSAHEAREILVSLSSDTLCLHQWLYSIKIRFVHLWMKQKLHSRISMI